MIPEKDPIHISWEDRCTNIRVLEVAKYTNIEAMLIHNQLHWVGHVLRIPDYQLLKQVLLAQQGGQKKAIKDNLKAILKKCNINVNNWERHAQERASRKKILFEDTMDFENFR